MTHLPISETETFWQYEDAMPADVKICGLKTPETVAAALAGGASHVGFVFFPRSPRYLTPAEAAPLADLARGRAKIVVLTVDASDALLDEIVAHVRPDILQVHGAEAPARCGEIRARFGLPVMKAIKVADADDLVPLADYVPHVDLFLFDAKAPKSLKDALPGGNGISFDWKLIAGLDPGRPFMLSGGLDPENVAEAIRLTGAKVVDVSSGVESAPGVKDPTLISAFLAAARIA
jgi:phosphoribosylanthranilate isomerase